jgi:hypothetical protein
MPRILAPRCGSSFLERAGGENRVTLLIEIRTEPTRREGPDRNEQRGRILDVFDRGVRRRAGSAAATATGEFQSGVLVTQSVLPFSGEDLLNKLRPWRRPDGVDCAHAWNTHVRAGRGRPDSAPNRSGARRTFPLLAEKTREPCGWAMPLRCVDSTIWTSHESP